MLNKPNKLTYKHTNKLTYKHIYEKVEPNLPKPFNSKQSLQEKKKVDKQKCIFESIN